MILKTMVDDIKLFSTKTCVAISPNYYEIHLTYDNRGQVVLTLENTHTELNTSMTISLNPDYIEWIDNQLKQGMYLVELLQKKQWFVAPGYTDKNKYIDELLQHIKELKAY